MIKVDTALMYFIKNVLKNQIRLNFFGKVQLIDHLQNHKRYYKLKTYYLYQVNQTEVYI